VFVKFKGNEKITLDRNCSAISLTYFKGIIKSQEIAKK
jgi:hypothetical protein